MNAEIGPAELGGVLRLDRDGETLVGEAGARGLLSARGQHRVLRVARTIADLEGSERVRARDVGQALALRSGASAVGSRAA